MYYKRVSEKSSARIYVLVLMLGYAFKPDIQTSFFDF